MCAKMSESKVDKKSAHSTGMMPSLVRGRDTQTLINPTNAGTVAAVAHHPSLE